MRSLVLLLIVFSTVAWGAIESKTAITHTKVSDNTKKIAAMFHLKPTEWKRYQFLKKGPAGLKNDKMNPVMMLGMYAESEDEKKHYAELYAQLNVEYIERYREWQNAYLETFHSNFPDADVIDMEGMYMPGKAASKTSLKTYSPKINDSVVLFIKPDCVPCERVYKKLLKMIPHIKLHIHFNTNDEKQIIKWANKHKVPQDFVSNKQLTLNKAGSLLKEWAITTFPSTLKRSSQDADFLPVGIKL